jgi:pilus assembly protein CpaF
VGEIRGPEAVDVLQAMNTGHSGSMTTIHANSPGDAITRLETMLLISGNNIDPFTAERIIATSLDIIVQLKKTKGGKRVIHQVSEILYKRNSHRDAYKKLSIKDIAHARDTENDQPAVFTGYKPSFLKQ